MGDEGGDRLDPDEDLRLRAMFMEAVANSSGDGVLVVDLQGRKIFQNQRTVELWKIPPEIVADPNGDRQVAHVMNMTKNPRLFVEEIEHQKRAPLDVTSDQLELIDGTVLDRHSAPVLGADGRNYGRIYHFHDVTGFRQAEERIRGLLDEKEVLLREVHHRVKNYMGTLLSILSLQAASLRESSAVAALRDAEARVQGMLALYDKLYMPSSLGNVPASKFLTGLVDEIIANFPKRTELSVRATICDFPMDAKTMQVLGMIANELLTNTMKYAFVGRAKGRIEVSLGKEGGRLRFAVGDDGIGLPDGVELGPSSGFGMMLVGLLVKQLDGSMVIERRGGTRYSLEFEPRA